MLFRSDLTVALRGFGPFLQPSKLHHCIKSMSLPKIISVAAVASIGAITWQRLNEDQKANVKNAVNGGRRKLANFIAPREHLGDLTDSVDPAIIQELSELMDTEIVLDEDDGLKTAPSPEWNHSDSE
jgi:hypothetical protein